MATDLSVVDALLESTHFTLTLRRHLACVSKLHRDRALVYFGRTRMEVRREDCTEENAEFLMHLVTAVNPKIELFVNMVRRQDYYSFDTELRTFLPGSKQPWIYNPNPVGRPWYDVDEPYTPIGAFFVGRAMAKLPRGEFRLWFEGWYLNKECIAHDTYVERRDIRDKMSLAELSAVAGVYRDSALRCLDRSPPNRHSGFAYFDLQHKMLDDEGARVVARELERRRMAGTMAGLWFLDLDRTFTPLSRGLFKQVVNPRALDLTHLQELRLSRNALTEEDIEAFCHALQMKAYPTLNNLCLHDVELTGDKLIPLLPHFRPTGGLHRLQHLDLSANPLGSAGVRDFRDAADDMPRLMHLRLKRVEASPKAIAALGDWLKTCADWPEIRVLEHCWDHQHSGGTPESVCARASVELALARKERERQGFLCRAQIAREKVAVRARRENM